MKQVTHRLLATLCLVLSSVVLHAQEKRTVTGVVTGAGGQALGGATIKEKGTSNSVVSETNGNFSIRINPNATLVMSYVGYNDTEVRTGNGSVYNTSLTENQSTIEGVVVTALGIKKEQRKLGYATTVVSGKDIVKTSPTNFASALYGKAPGVQINTQPGGATSAVSIQIRGVNSMGFQGEPLIVVDGVIIRNGGANNEGYWGGNQKLNGNGLLDINPENIETVNILKGAAASALYGSDATFGVIVITTKSGKGYNKGAGVELNLSGNMEQVSVTPDLQTEYGPGYDRTTNMASFGADDAGWINTTLNGQNVVRPIFRAYGQFGPKLDGRQVAWWDGKMRDYSPQKNNWKAFYRNGYSTIANIAVSNATDKMNYRLSYTRNDYKGIQIGGKQEKNTFTLNSSYKVSSKVSLDLVANYVNEKVHNRPRQIYFLTNNFGGFFSPADHMGLYFDKYQTSKGYKWVRYDSNLDLEERLKYHIRAYDYLDFLWNQLANSYDETTNRLMASATLNYNIIKGLNFRGRLGTDYTGYYQETKERSTQPLSFGPTGSYSTSSNRYNYTYGDLLLSYQHQLVKNLSATASVGYQARTEDYRYNGASTRDGLTTENWFSLSASKTTPTSGTTSTKKLVKDGLFGILSFDYHNYLFVEGTLRRERSSSLDINHNTFYYPGVSAAFELSNAFNLPAAVSYSKLRAAFGVVGNPPPAYAANVVYDANNIQGVPILTPPSARFGNKELKNEKKQEIEFGWENRFLNNRLGFDITYYNDKIIDQIMYLSIPATAGSTSALVNVGTMRNSGVEISLYGTPVKTRSVSWDSRLNLAFNRNNVVSLMPGLNYFDHANIDNGSLLVRSKPGEKAGNIYVYKRKTDSKGRYIVGNDGLYVVNYDEQVKGGNVQADVVGGLMNTVSYKNFTLNFLVDFRWGGQIVSTSLLYGTGAGMYKNSLFGRDAAHGGIAYYVDKTTGKNVQAVSGAIAGPGGEKLYRDGMVLKGVNANGQENTTVVDAPNYYLSTYNWGSWPSNPSGSLYEGAVFDNNFIKMREVSLSYALPGRLASKLGMQNLTFSVYGRNLFYIYKSLPYLDAEEGVGTDWISRSTSAGSGNAATRSMGASLRLAF